VTDLKRALKPADYNARDATETQLHSICRSLIEFGFVDPLIARREDGLILGGHQRFKAIERLLSGPFTFKHKNGQKVTVDWSHPKEVRLTNKDGSPVLDEDGHEVILHWAPPAEGYPIVFLDGVSPKRAKLLNLALNRATGDWEHDKLASLLRSLNEDLDIHELGVTAFSPAELTDYIDIADEVQLQLDDDGKIPAPAQGAPKLTLDFSSKEIRDAVKEKLGAEVKGTEPSGDTIARLLGVKPKRTKRTAA
jgi:hypothetical protein